MELTDLDIIQIQQLSKNDKCQWMQEKRKPLLSDYGLTKDDIEKVDELVVSKTRTNINKFLAKLKDVIEVLPLYFFFLAAPIFGIVITVFPKGEAYFISCIISLLVFLIWLFGRSYVIFIGKCDFQLKKTKLEIIHSKKKEYEDNLVLYEKWLAYNIAIDEKQHKRDTLHNRNIKYFPFEIAFTDVFKNRFYKLDAQYWRDLDPLKFEKKVAELYEKQLDYNVKLTKLSGDGGVDIVLRKDKEIKYVQCKHYCKSNRLGVSELREFYGVCSADSVNGIMVCTSPLTSEAEIFLNKIKYEVEVVGIDDLVSMSNGMQSFCEINSRIYPYFVKYLTNNNFLYYHHCYILQECYNSEKTASNRVSQLTEYGNAGFCYKVIHVIDQNELNYYFVAFVVSKQCELYSSFKIDLPLLSDASLMAKRILDIEYSKIPSFDPTRQKLIEYFDAYAIWRNNAKNIGFEDDELKSEYDNLFKKKVPRLPIYDSKKMSTNEYMDIFRKEREQLKQLS